MAKAKKNKITTTGWEYALKVINIISLVIIAFTMLYPFWEILVKSFMTDEEINSNIFCLWPTKFQFRGYVKIFTDKTYRFGQAFLNSIFITVLGTIYQLLITSLASYALSREELPGKKILFTYFIITMYFGGGIIPYYIVIRNLGLRNNIMVMVLPFFMSVYNMLIMRNFYSNIPKEMEEAAKLDGASDWAVFFKVVFPLSGAIMATIALYIAVGQWNNWYTALLFLDQDPTKRPLAYTLQYIIEKSTSANDIIGGINVEIIGQSVSSAAIVVAVFPIMMVYPFFQKYFTNGVLVGSVKG